MKIRKKEPSVGVIGKIVNSFSSSKNDTYSADFINNVTQRDITTDGKPVKCGYKIDDKDVYVKRVSISSLPEAGKMVEYDIGLPKVIVHDLKVKINWVAKDVAMMPLCYSPQQNEEGAWDDGNVNNISTPVYLYEKGALRIQSSSDRSNTGAIVTIYFSYEN